MAARLIGAFKLLVAPRRTSTGTESLRAWMSRPNTPNVGNRRDLRYGGVWRVRFESDVQRQTYEAVDVHNEGCA